VIGKTLAHYAILEKIGAGGMGEVYAAEDIRLGRKVAIKVLPGDMARDADRRMRFQREARAIAALNHPNIVTIHAVEEADGVPFLVMELVEGRSLADKIPSGGMPLSRLFGVAIPLADALATAHKQGITHRDLKPANVMIAADGTVKVLDFGLAKLVTAGGGTDAATLAASDSRTEEGRVLGTVAYMSPEQAEGKPVDERTDIFSLGVLLYEMATGRRPFAGDTSISTITAILRDNPPSVTEVNPALPRHLGRIIRLCLAKDPDQRYQSAVDVRNELQSLHQEITSGELTQRAATTARTRPPRPRPVLVGIAAVAVVLAAVLGRFLLRSVATQSPATVSPPGETTVAVVGFENLGDPDDTDQIGRMLMGLVTTHLAESGGADVVSMPRVLAALRDVRPEGGRFDPTYAADVARAAGATLMVVGQVGRAGERLIFTAEIDDVATGRTLGSHHEEATSTAELFSAAGAIASHLARSVPGVGGSSEDIDLSRVLTDSPEAYRRFVAGELAFHQTDYEGALRHLDRAIQEDSTFALAYYRAAIATWWKDNLDTGLVYLQQGRAHASRLPDRWQTIYTAALDFFSGEYERARAALKALAAADMDIADVYYLLGESEWHFAKYRDIGAARRHFEKALEIDPSFRIVLHHLIVAYIYSADLESGKRLLERFEPEDPDDPGLLWATVFWHLAQGRCEDALGGAERLCEILPDEVHALSSVYTQCGQPDRAIELIDRRGRPGDSGDLSIWDRARADILLGRFHDAMVDWDRACRGFADGGGWLTIDVSIGHHLRAVALALAGDLAAAEAEARTAVATDPLVMRSRYWLGWILLRAGDNRAADRALAEMEAAAGQIEAPHSDYWPHLLGAEVLLARDRAAEAAAELEPLSALPPEYRHVQHECFLRGRILDALGDPAGAIVAYREVGLPRSVGIGGDCVLWTRSLYRLAIAEEKVGQVTDARENYEEFLRRWGEADIHLPQVEDARTRLARLAG